MFGTHRTLEQKVIQSEKMSGGKNPAAKKVLCIETNIIYDCCRDAANILKLGPDKITGGKIFQDVQVEKGQMPINSTGGM